MEKSFFSRIKEGLQKSSSKLSENFTRLLSHKSLNDATLNQIEDILIQADLGNGPTKKIINRLRTSKFDPLKLDNPEGSKSSLNNFVKQTIAHEITSLLSPYTLKIELPFAQNPYVILLSGVNGSGKTTTIVKMAHSFQNSGQKVMIVAGDIFRAAAVEQLQTWGKKLGIRIFTGDLNSSKKKDVASLVFEAYQVAKNESIDVLLIDTAGRLHTNSALMDELEKINRVLKKISLDLPHQSLLSLDATTGQNAYIQIEQFNKSTPLTGLIVTKLDGTARGGVIIGIVDIYKIPIYVIGVGEKEDDLQAFDPEYFANALLDL